MKANGFRWYDRCGNKIRAVGAYLAGFQGHDRLRRPDPQMNDGWTAEDIERQAQEYGDFGDCWWPGKAGRRENIVRCQRAHRTSYRPASQSLTSNGNRF